ncbi:hypothetical protein CYANOKiyG1_36830 [Okeania sp. KiyG1]|nr:hypothetical protein CYANOKiyG1_36830 [Okeania sp. KiyG1]
MIVILINRLNKMLNILFCNGLKKAIFSRYSQSTLFMTFLDIFNFMPIYSFSFWLERRLV